MNNDTRVVVKFVSSCNNYKIVLEYSYVEGKVNILRAETEEVYDAVNSRFVEKVVPVPESAWQEINAMIDSVQSALNTTETSLEPDVAVAIEDKKNNLENSIDSSTETDVKSLSHLQKKKKFKF